ncbi:MAG TPA: hypothetical protein VEB88_05375 [Candidatus Acidoferrales bacterium]|nr:hypothetical protein [Candidatus Acidoferrales bacterium]
MTNDCEQLAVIRLGPKIVVIVRVLGSTCDIRAAKNAGYVLINVKPSGLIRARAILEEQVTSRLKNERV